VKSKLPFLETMVTQACNLSCEGCTNYSDLSHKGFVSWSDTRKVLERWLNRVDILDFGIMGGEPLLHPNIEDWILGVRKIMPAAQIRFTTNGLLLEKKIHIVKLLEQIGNCVLKITVHTHDIVIERMIDKIKKDYDWTEVIEFGIRRWKTSNNLRFQINRPTTFIKPFVNSYQNMSPHNSNPIEAFDNCCQQTCPLLLGERILKCSSNGLLTETLERFGRPNWDQWQIYLNQGILPDCSDDDLSQFLTNFGKPHKICGMCPTKADTKSHVIHLNTVRKQKIKY